VRKAFIRISFTSKEKSKIVFEALKPETLSQPAARSKVEVQLEKSAIMLQIKARDTTALRAATNAYLRWIYSTQKVLEVLESLSKKRLCGNLINE
jgi:tRNA threonylcarbamoyladenosine modification (KEOPS) complex  Pcc1 subunit